MTDKEQITIDGKLYNPCNGCELWDGDYCTGDKSYEPNGKIHSIICDRHMAEQFWKVRNELIHKEQILKELKEENARYLKALEEIEGLIQSTLDDFEEDDEEVQLSYCHNISLQILGIISKANPTKNKRGERCLKNK